MPKNRRPNPAHASIWRISYGIKFSSPTAADAELNHLLGKYKKHFGRNGVYGQIKKKPVYMWYRAGRYVVILNRLDTGRKSHVVNVDVLLNRWALPQAYTRGFLNMIGKRLDTPRTAPK